MSLPTLNTAFPQIEPWFDLRGHLTSGWRAVGTQTFGMWVQPNTLTVTARLRADEATHHYIALEIPYRGPQNMPLDAKLDGTPIVVELNRGIGRLEFAAAYRHLPLIGELTISGIIPRGTPPI